MTTWQAVRPEGGIVPPSLFQHLAAPPTDGDATWRSSLAPESYHLPPQTTLRDAASRSWTYLVGAWQSWRRAQDREPGGFDATAAALVRERWLLVLLQELGYGRLSPHTGGVLVGEHTYPVSHLWRDVPIHLLGPGVELDKRNSGVTGAVRAPQAMVQELLNRSDDHLWAILSNGKRLRLLRDSTALAGSAYIEFDLEAIFEGELFADFLLLWQVCHESRFEPRTSGSGDPTLAESWLEVWRAESVRSGARALDQLRGGVERALEHLGTGFVSHPANTDLRTALAAGTLKADDVHRHLLRLVYRLLFLFVTEDRDLLLDREAPEVATRRYRDYLSTARLRRHARERTGSTTYGDLWQGQRLVLHALGDDGEASLGLPALGGLFDTDDGTEPLLAAELTNHAFLEAIRDLAWIRRSGERLQPVDYRNLGAEELGSVYEALLELVPQVDVARGTLTYQRLSGNERKTTGSYYTPPALVSALLDTALDPVIDEAVAGVSTAAEAEQRLLDLKVCDPACGSGHFLVAAARRVAQRLAAVRSGENQPTPADVRHALRDVIGRCVYGVDLNPLAAELAKVSLWLEAMEPGKALGFLDARIRIGNSLLGTTPTLLAGGVPDGAFKPLEGDDKDVVREAAKRNKAERGKTTGLARGTRVSEWIGQDQLDLSTDAETWEALAEARGSLLQQQDNADAVRAQAKRWREYETSADYLDRRVQADAWVAAFVWPYTRVTKVDGAFRTTPQAPTSAVVQRLGREPHAAAVAATRAHVERLATEYRFFHWHLEFPEVFTRGTGAPGPQGWTGGFDAVLGNPPWEQLEIDETEYFSSRDPSISQEQDATIRAKLISRLELEDPQLWREYAEAREELQRVGRYARGALTLAPGSRGRVNSYRLFAAQIDAIVAESGHAGYICPSGMVTDATSSLLLQRWIEKGTLGSVAEFTNRNLIFPGVRRPVRFALVTIAPRGSRTQVLVASRLESLTQYADNSRWTLLPYDTLKRLSPETGAVPLFRSPVDARTTTTAYTKGTLFGATTLTTKQGFLNLTSDAAEMIRDPAALPVGVALTPVVESKMTAAFDYGAFTFEDVPPERMYNRKASPLRSAKGPNTPTRPRYWVRSRWSDPQWPSKRSWVLAGKELANANTSARTSVFCALPRTCPAYTLQLVYDDSMSASDLTVALGVLNSLAFDYFARQKLSGPHLTATVLRQLPLPSRTAAPFLREVVLRNSALLSFDVSELVADLLLEAVDVSGAPVDRMAARDEIDAAVLHLYGFDRDSADHVVGSFDVLARMELKSFGEFRTARRVLEIYDAMQHAIDSGTEYQTILDPPPGEGPRHPPKE
ncbi:DNA methyltransferase [Miniimonas sp. S16]|uniref:Eco57I restriction-modification methylase domain-containing protein n=1 Tax=Miniimonas sp. S16 TaxID=2171623 RepID=UPI000D529659|nr:DNA methyltransferase [Miniimonas sp. S16]